MYRGENHIPQLNSTTVATALNAGHGKGMWYAVRPNRFSFNPLFSFLNALLPEREYYLALCPSYGFRFVNTKTGRI